MYSIDTSAILEGWVRSYPPDVFGTVWAKLKGLGNGGTLFTPDEVIEELKKKEDGAWKWAKDELQVHAMDGEIQTVVAGILAAHQRLVDERKNRSKGDPFVIALAKMRGFAVVTAEKASGNLQKPKIPDVCLVMNIKCITLLDLFRQQGWQI